MTERAIIAFGKVYSWRGVYVHRNGNPSALGPVLYKMLKSGLITKDLIQEHPGGFLDFPDDCFCHGTRAPSCGSCVKESPYYSKGLPDMVFSKGQADPVIINWVYVVDDSWINLLASHPKNRVYYRPYNGTMVKAREYGFRHVSAVNLVYYKDEWLSFENNHRQFLKKRLWASSKEVVGVK